MAPPTGQLPSSSVDQTRANYRTARLVAVVAGLLGAALAILTPLMPVKQTTAQLNWPQNGVLQRVNAPLISYVATDLNISIPSRAADGLQPTGRTVLLSTHILSEAQQICDRVLIINKGKIVAEDTPENLQARLTGSERVALLVRGETDELPKIINKIKGVQRVESMPDGSVEFQFAPGQDVRPEVARTVIKSGYDLLEMRPVGMSLEEIFLELTREDKPSRRNK